MAVEPEKKLAGILLAAGASSRFGAPKQLAAWLEKPLVCHAVEALLAACDAGVTVVTGAHGVAVEAEIKRYPVTVVQNPDWSSGVASSIRTGVAAVRSTQQMDGVLITVCDQPLVGAAELGKLVAVWRSKPTQITAAFYDDILGVPAIIPRSELSLIDSLDGDTGARAILRAAAECQAVCMPEAARDIDRLDDLDAALARADK